ncbi:hypothetical protein [Sphingomonas sp.]|uniref:hypothetical protein n=1 Tax=Sphingomonas sp. TaxID=28214 RepID=UPI0025EB6DC2|nr:hypothetical protein [Sphingomonas sp.]
MLDRLAPASDSVLDYDRRNLLTYAELLDAADAGVDWLAGALDILGIDPVIDAERARACWDSHLARARWIVGDGLGAAIEAFGTLPRNRVRGSVR